MFQIFVLLILHQNVVSDHSPNRRNIDESFDVNIGAGYAVGLNQSPPNGTSNISFTKDYYSSPLVAEALPPTSIRAPRILTNFTSHIVNLVPEKSKNHAAPQEYHVAEPSNSHSFYSSPFQALADEHLEQPNSVKFEKVLNEMGSGKPYSKIFQVIKVPAIYEIHLQSDGNHISKNKINLNPTTNLFWKNYEENKSTTVNLNSNDYNNWSNGAETQYPDDYAKWSNNVHLQKEELLSEDGGNSYDFSDTPVVSYENLHEHNSFHDKPEGRGISQPTITHHYSNTRTFPNTFDNDRDVKINYSYEAYNKPAWLNKINNFKRHASGNSHIPRGLNPPPLNEIITAFNMNVKNYTPFKHNHIITEDGKPQALHEVPAPVLGKHPQPRPFEIQKEITPTAPHKQVKAKFNKLSTSTGPVGYNIANGFFGKMGMTIEPEALVASSSKRNQNLVYGKKNAHVLTPYEVNIPVTPGSIMVTVAENAAKYFPSVKRNLDTTNNDKPKDRNYQHLINVNNSVNVFTRSSQILEDKQNPYENSNSQKDAGENKSVNSFRLGKADINSNNQQIDDMSYQTKETIDPESFQLTALSPDTISLKSSNSSSIISRQSEQTDAEEKNVDANAVFSKMIPPTFSSKESFRRRASSPTYNINGYVNNRYLIHGHDSKMFQRKNNSPRPDYMIYITRKSTH